MANVRDWQIEAEDGTKVNYASRQTAMKGARAHCLAHPNTTVLVKQFDYDLMRFRVYTRGVFHV